jgi:hypothetical protein
LNHYLLIFSYIENNIRNFQKICVSEGRGLAKGVAINVGANTEPEWGGFRGPIFPNGSFEFVHIPWKEKYGTIQPQPKKYESYKSFE